MAEDLWLVHPAGRVMDERKQQLIAECKRQQESCECTSASFIEWLKSSRQWHRFFVASPIVLGAVGSSPLFANLPWLKLVAGGCAFLAGVIPAIYKALNLDVNLETLAKSEHQFRILRDRFRQACTVTALGSFEEFKSEFDALMDRMDAARAGSLAPPERFFKKAQEKIKRGDYRFSVDQDSAKLEQLDGPATRFDNPTDPLRPSDAHDAARTPH